MDFAAEAGIGALNKTGQLKGQTFRVKMWISFLQLSATAIFLCT